MPLSQYDIIAGVVLDENLIPMPGANIYLVDANDQYQAGFPGIHASINPPGQFSFVLPGMPLPMTFYSIACSFIGYKTQILSLGAFVNGPIAIYMEPTAYDLPVVVITPDDDKKPFPWWLLLPALTLLK